MAKTSTFDLEKTAFTPEELSAIAAQWSEKEEPGFFSQAVDTAGAIITGAPLVMRGAGFGLRDLVQGFDPNDTEAMAERAAYELDLAAYQKKYEGSGAVPEAFAEAAGSSGPSLVGTGASLVGMGLGTLGGPVGMAGGAFAAGGAAAARMDYAAASAQLYDEVVRRMGRKPTDAEWQGILSDMRPELLKHAAIEGVGEGAGDVLLGAAFKPFAPLAKAAGGALGSSVAGKVARGAGSLGAGIAGEVVTETGQQWGQGHVEANMFGGEAPTIGEAFEQVAGPTAAQTVMTGGLIGGARLGLSMLRRTTPSNSPDNPFAEQAQEQVGADGYTPTNPLNLEQAEAPREPKNSPEVDLLGVLNKRLEAKNDAADRTMAAVYGKLAPKLDADGKVLEEGGGIDSLEDGSLVVYGSRDNQGDGVDEAPLVLTSEEDKRIALDVARQLREEQSARERGQNRREAPAWIAKQGKPVSADAFSARNNGYQVPAGELAPVDITGMTVPSSAPMMSGGNLGLQLGERAERMAAWDGAQPVPQIASMAMPQTMAQPAPVQSAPTIPNSGFGLAGVQPAQPQKVEPLLEGLPEVEPVSVENVTKQPEMMAENVTPAKPLSTESSTNVEPENKSKSKGELRGVPLDQRIVIGAPAPVGASRDDIREAEQRFNDFRKKEEDIQKRHAEAFEELKKRASKVETKEEADALLDEYTKVEGYHLEGYDQLSKMTASSVSRAEERRRLEDRKRRYDAGEWVVAAETNSVEQAERERDRLTKNDPDNEYRVESDMDGWRGVVMKRKRSPKTSDETEPLAKKDYGTADSLDVNAIADHFFEQFSAGKSYRTIGEARQEVASLLGLKQKDLVKQVKTIDEAIELGVVKAARKIVRSGKPQLEIYRDLVDLYKRQPNLGVRTSTSVAEQAYSTPVPLAYLADVLAGVNENTRVYEPTAGNGALLLTASPENAVVNELNHDRAERLRSLGFDVTEEDASTRQLDEDVDAVVANPPFGTVLLEGGKGKRKFRFRNLETNEIDQAISLNALDELKKDGRAVLIIGGKQGGEDARSKKYNTAGQRAFWDTLFRNFNVVDHFTVDGKLYSRQGASYPIDFIVIDGHTPTENPVFPAAKVPPVFDSFESLEVKFNEVLRNESERTERDGVAERGDDSQPVRTDGRDSSVGREVPDGRDAGDQAGNDAGLDGRAVDQERRAGSVGDDGKSGKRDQRTVRDNRRSGSDGDTAEPSQSDDQRGRLAGDDGNGRGGPGIRAGEELSQPDGGAGAVRAGLDVNQPALPETPKAKRAAPKPKETETQSSYKTSSDGFRLGTLVPRNMDAPVQDALLRVKDSRGGVDEFVADELGYDSVEEMHKAFAAEQVDALALALDNIKSGKGFILGDQTGIGKGRVCAGIIRWARKNGKTPVFVTMLPDLYADMMRDLNDIGVHDFHPFITNDSIRGTKSLVAPDGSKLSAPTDTNYKKALAYVKEHKALPEEYDAVFTSYSQMQSKKNSSNPRQQMLIALRDNVVLVLDEAHNAGGSESSIGMFFRSYTEGLDNGVLYSSATYAKRPDVMSLYNTTDLSLLGSKEEIEEIMHSGGLPMQQVVSAMLTSSGQYVRREKSYEGADMTTTEAPVSTKLADSIADCMDAVMKFSVEMGPVIEHMDKILKAQGKMATGNQGTGGAGASSTTFGAVMHNLVAQSTLAIKADATIKAAKAAVERGEKPIITLSNTMGSFIEEYVKANGLKAGDHVSLSFADLFKNYLEKTREVTVTPPNARPEDKQRIRVADKDLTPGARAAYRNALRLIESVDFSGIPVSPIDYILDGLRREGVSASEITGRTATLDYSGAVPVYRVREASVAEKQKASSGFNGGSIDVLIINRSGSTGISLHASEKFADQKRRTMFILQPDLNIDVFMQTLGRVFRTGQVVPPKYEFILSDMPSERRPAAVLGKKMASLNANTTASAKGTQSFDNIPDFLNVYGDQAAFEILTEDRALDQRLGNILGDGEKYDNLVAKLTGRIPLLRMAEQADVYDRLQSVYQGIVDMATATGTNVLDVKSKPLDAKVVRRAEFTPQEATGSPFGEASELCECDVKVLGKPFTSAEVKQHILDGKAAAVSVEELAERKRAYEKERLKKMENEEVRARESEKLDEQFVRVSEAMTGYPVGTRVRLNSTTGSYVGFVVNYVFDAKKKGSNPVAPSSWRVVVDIADAKRRIAIPMSKLVLGDGNIDEGRVLMNHTYDGVSDAVFLKRFDEGQSESREKRFIVMGNIPAGFKFAEKGEIITFDMHDGRRVMGLMLPKDVSGDQLLSDKPVVFGTPVQAEEFLTQGSDIRQVKSSDEKLSIDNTGRFGTFSVRVPASKKDGGTYFLDKKLTDAMGAIFTKSGQDMKAMVDKEDLPAMLNYLYQRGVKLQATSNKVEARKITGETGKLEGVSPAKGRSSRMSESEQILAESLGLASLRPSFASNSPYAALRLTPETRDRMNRVVGEVKANAIRGKGAAAAIAQARAWAKANINNPIIKTVERGKVVFDEGGIKDSLSHKPLYQNKLDSVPVIKHVLEDGAYLGSFDDLGGNDIVNHYWAGRARFADGDHLVFVRVREVKGREQRFYVHDVFSDELIKKATPLTQEEMALLDQAGSIGNKTGRPGRSVEGVTLDSQRSTLPRGVVLEARILRTIMEVNGQSRKSVQDVVDKLNGSVTGAAPVNVVQSFDGLPEKLKQVLKQNFKDRAGDIDGVYDEGTVWLVADNLASPERVAEVWMHEQVGHGGFEALMPEKEKVQLLNRLFGMMGGKNNAALRAIAEEYGLDLDKRAHQHRALREYLADLAEKEGLSGQEMTRWQRAWKHIADTLKKLVYRLTGQHAKIAEMEVRDLLSAMKARVRDGGPDGPKGGTYASFISDAAKGAADKVAKAMKKPEGFSDDFMESYKNLSAQAKRDLSVWNRFVSQPYALAKKFPLIRSLMDIQSEREDKRREAYTSSMAGVDTFQKMKESDPTAYKYARDLIIALDSETGDKLKTQLDEDMFIFDEDGKRTGFNPKYYSQLRELVLRARNQKTHSDGAAFERAVDAYMGVRRSLDRDLASILTRMEELGFKSREAYLAEFEKRKAELEADKTLTKKQRQDALDAISMANKREQEKLDTLRKSMGRRPFYFPRMRFGDYFARFVDADGKTLYRVHYDASTRTQAAYEAAKIKATMEAELKKMGVDLADVKFENGKIEGIPQEVFADALSTVDTQAILERALGRLQEKGEVTGEELTNLREALFDQVSEVLKSSGFGQHMMRRGNSNIAGYETEDVFKSLSAYKAGLHGWLTKMEASYAFASTLSEAAEDGAARKSPKMYGYAKQYVRDMLRNSDAIDRTNSRIRAGLFLWFLGGNIKSALVNATQNFSLGIPVLGAEIGFGKAYGKVLSGSHDAVVDWASKREAGQESKNLTRAEAAFLDDFQKHGEALARKTMELTGMQDRSWASTWYGKLAEWAGKPIEYAEKFNRLSLALAAYRAAKAGDVTNESTLAEYGEEKGKPWSEASARKFAREVVNEAHFVYGKANQPAPVRGFARGLGFGYTFRTYAQSLGSWYYHMLAGDKGSVGRIAAAQAALHATVLGGVAAIPLYGTMRTVLAQLFGGEPPEEVLGYDQIDVLMYGLPSLGGVYLGGSMELDLPAIAGAKQGDESWIEQLHDNVFLAVTGPFGGALDRLGRATYFADTGQTGRVLEEVAPTAVTNILKAHRLATTGARTKSGKPIPALGDKSGKPAQLSGAEVLLQGLGFQPMSRAKSWNAYQTKQEKSSYKSDFQSDLVTRYVMAKASKDWKEVDNLVAEWKAWNKEHPDQKIKPLAQLAKRRERPVK